MLPVSSWPPQAPGSSLSPFGAPKCINLNRRRHGYILPKGAWVVQTGANQVVMFRPDWRREADHQPSRQMGTGNLPGSLQWSRARPPGPWWKTPLWRRPTHDEYLEAWRAWQRCIAWSDPVQRPLPGRNPPNWAGWWWNSRSPRQTLIPFGQSGTVLADGQNVVIIGGGTAVITQAYSV